MFSSSDEEQRDWPLETFVSRLSTTFGSPETFILGCLIEGILVCSVGLYREGGLKRMHSAVIFGMHDGAERHGRGYGRGFLVAAPERARRMAGLALVRLAVEATNEPARSLYASLGFETYGIERHALFVDGEYLDEELMALMLPS